MNEDLRTRVALMLIGEVGAHRARLLMERVDRPSDLFRLSSKELTSIHGIGEVVARNIRAFNQWEKVDDILRNSESPGCKILIPEDSAYPERLRQKPDPPIVLWVQGDVDLLQNNGIAIVGTRSPSLYGKLMTRKFATELVEKGLVVISGLAYGIDSIAHRSAVEAGGKTIAVLGSGIDRIYPSLNQDLADRIIKENGAIVSEFPPGTKPDRENFPVRNRTVCGLSLGVLIVETGVKGGSMHTVNAAYEQNREVFVVPHALTNPRASGCHKLIRESAGKLVETTDDILSEFPWLMNCADSETKRLNTGVFKLAEPPESSSKEAIVCWQVLRDGKTRVYEEIVAQSKMDPADVSLALIELEISGCVRPRPGNRFELLPL